MGYQFIHVETYARTPGKNSKTRASAGAVFAEARRDAGYCEHVNAPKPPIKIFGQALETTEAQVFERAGLARDKRGRPLRKDAPILIAGVASYPVTSEELLKANKLERDRYTAWRDKTIDFLKAEYGDALKTVILHIDEKHPHLHFYVAPDLRADLSLNTDDLHRGKAAQKAAAEAQRMKAYKTAMRAYQDDYQAMVGTPAGLTRKGPGKRRLTREAWLAEKEQAAHLAKNKAEIEKLKADLEATRHQLGSRISQERIKAKERISQIEKQLAAWKTRAQDAEIHLHHTREELKGEKRKVREAVRSSGGFNPSTADLPGIDQLTPPKPDAPSY